jgi:hypothetical protein
MSFAVRYQIKLLKDDINEGDVILTNHPVAGGSHLPVRTPSRISSFRVELTSSVRAGYHLYHSRLHRRQYRLVGSLKGASR